MLDISAVLRHTLTHVRAGVAQHTATPQIIAELRQPYFQRKENRMSDELTIVNDAPIEAKEAAATSRKEAQSKARAYLRAVAAGQHPEIASSTPDTVMDALCVLFPVKAAKSAAGAGRLTVIDRICAMFPEVGAEVSLLDIFREFRMGVAEMRIRIRECIYNRPAESRYWITYNPDTEVYRLEGIGANPPEGWKGVLPKEMR